MKIDELVIEALENAEHIYVIGNGGSASISDHFACDLLKNTCLPAISLCSNSAIITAIANDYSFDYIYSMQLRMLFQSRDVLVVFSGSGDSRNLIEAVKVTKRNIVVSGNKGGKLIGYASIFHELRSNTQMECEIRMSEFCHTVTDRLIERPSMFKERRRRWQI